MSEVTLSGVKITCDVGGTFTDVVAADRDGRVAIGKALTTPERLIDGLHAGMKNAAEQLGVTVGELLAATELFVYATTQATNAVLEGTTSRTALLCTEGFPDILVRREGGSLRPYDYDRDFPDPYIPRRLTLEIRERIGADGEVVVALDEEGAERTIASLAGRDVEAVAVCLLWSTVNPSHEQRLGEMIEAELGVPYTLSHRLNPIVREYRRASCAAIDASLKPLMQHHLSEVAAGLEELGFDGRLFAANSLGGVLPIAELAERPAYALRSGPSLAPVAGRAYSWADLDGVDVVVCDTGGTSFDVSLVRDGEIVTTRETWLGEQFVGHLTGLSSVDSRSIGAGGGSIAWVDSGGLLRVGPQSAGSAPGPACYGLGGEEPTVTDAAVVLGYLDPSAFLGGRMRLDADRSRSALAALGAGLEMDAEAAAHAAMTVANEHMVSAIREITINQGADPRDSVIIAGGGAAGLGIAAIAAELGAPRVLVPRTAGALSAFGGQQADIVAEQSRSLYADSRAFPFEAVNELFAELRGSLAAFGESLGLDSDSARVDFSVAARYTHQVWDIEIPVEGDELDEQGLGRLVRDFHATHKRIFAVSEPDQTIELMQWTGRLSTEPFKPPLPAAGGSGPAGEARFRKAWFGGAEMEAAVYEGGSLAPGFTADGPLLISEPTTTVVAPPGVVVTVTETGNYLLEAA